MSFGPADQAIALETIERLGASLTRWEESFIASIRDRLNAGHPLTARQVETLERIYTKRTG